MSINAEVQESINGQINSELASYYSYLSMVAYFETTPYAGFTRWMRLQATEEQGHAMKFFDYLCDRGGSVKLQAIPEPPSGFSSPLNAFEQSLAQERRVTGQINKLFEIAQKAGDYTTMNFLGWFLNEQVEEEKTTSDMVEKLRLAGDKADALLLLDREAAGRPVEGSESL